MLIIRSWQVNEIEFHVRGSLLIVVMIHEWIAASTHDYSFENEPCA